MNGFTPPARTEHRKTHHFALCTFLRAPGLSCPLFDIEMRPEPRHISMTNTARMKMAIAPPIMKMKRHAGTCSAGGGGEGGGGRGGA
eukprot:3148366-Prymnesium_polylepis.1